MECIIPGTNLKVLAKALQALSKIGDELLMESKIDGLSLITLNSSKTVCARCHFFDTFFSCYELKENDLDVTENGTLNCRIHMKIFLPLFKGSLEKKLDYFKMEYSAGSDFIIFKMKYKSSEVTMTHKLRLMDTERLVGALTDTGVNNISASSSFYNQLLTMFNPTDDEVTLEISPAKVVARNYHLGTPCRPKMMRTQINLNTSEFLIYNATKSTALNFLLKPFRTVVHFAENFNLDITFNFEVGGKPLSIISKDVTFEVKFIVATVNPYVDSNSSVVTTDSLQSQGPEKQSVEITDDDDMESLMAEIWNENDLINKKSCSSASMDREAQEKENIDVIPKSPEPPSSKRAKTVFGRCYDPTFHETVLGEVLAANSDSE